MAISLQPERLKRYHSISKLLLKHGGSFGDTAADLDESRLKQQVDAPAEEGHAAEKFVNDLESLGPTFIKLGQLLSTRPDFLPPAYTEALTRLQDNVEPVPFKTIAELVEQELGVTINKAFAEFSVEPMASASLGQVHLAQLKSGKPVAVKVQRPGIRDQVIKDLKALEDLADTAETSTEAGRRYALSEVLAEFKSTLLRELDYEIEAGNLITMHQHLQEYDDILIPLPVKDYCSPRLLTMDYIQGAKVTMVTPLRRLELNGKKLAAALCKAYLEQILIHGFFHADPHPGNVFLTDDNRIALIDLGMVAHVDPQVREQLLQIMFAISEGHGHEVADLSMKLGKPLHSADRDSFRKQVGRLLQDSQGESISHIETGRILLEMVKISSACGIRPASELSLLGKTLLNIDLVTRTLDPNFDPNEFVRQESSALMERHLLQTLSPSSLFGSLLETQALLRKMPGRISEILDLLTRRELEIRINAFDQTLMMSNLQKIANRITIGIILASLVVGAAMMMRIETDFQLLGYPGLAILLFLAAALMGLWLVISMLIMDTKDRRPPER